MTDSLEEAQKFAEETWATKKDKEREVHDEIKKEQKEEEEVGLTSKSVCGTAVHGLSRGSCPSASATTTVPFRPVRYSLLLGGFSVLAYRRKGGVTRQHSWDRLVSRWGFYRSYLPGRVPVWAICLIAVIFGVWVSLM